MNYRLEAERLRDLYFDHLGARQMGQEFEVWLSLRQSDGQRIDLRTSTNGSSPVPSVSDLWLGAAWCEREAAEAFAITFDAVGELLLLSDESERGYLRKEATLVAREMTWPGSFDPAGKSVKPIGGDR